MTDCSQALARFVAETRFEQLPPAAVAMTKRCLLDALGVTLAASTLGEGCGAFVELAREQGGAPESTLLGFGHKVPALMAAFANGSMAHALDFEDAHDRALTHPNAATVPAALAAAEARGDVDGKRILTAIAVGCEVVCRLGFALRVALDDYGWYPPPILGAFGATAAAAHIYELDAQQTLDAFSLALCQATCSAEIKHSPHSVIRAVRDAFAAKTGILSAQLAKRNIRGFDQPFEGQAGFFALYARGQYEPSELTTCLGERFAIETISFKPWPTCRGTHVYIEGALALAAAHSLQPDDIKAVRTCGHRINRMLAEPLASKQRPNTAIDAKFSIPFATATALVHGAVALDHFTPAALKDETVLGLARRISFEAADSDAHSVDDVTRGSIDIDVIDGRTLSRRMERPFGHPDNPMSEAALLEKFLACGRYAANRSAAASLQKIADVVLSLDDVTHFNRELTTLLA